MSCWGLYCSQEVWQTQVAKGQGIRVAPACTNERLSSTCDQKAHHLCSVAISKSWQCTCGTLLFYTFDICLMSLKPYLSWPLRGTGRLWELCIWPRKEHHHCNLTAVGLLYVLLFEPQNPRFVHPLCWPLLPGVLSANHPQGALSAWTARQPLPPKSTCDPARATQNARWGCQKGPCTSNE